MNKKSRFILSAFVVMGVVLTAQIFYLYSAKSIDSDMLKSKQVFVRLTALPDLAISTEATYIRHRSMGTMFSIYKDDGTLREYFPSTFAYAPSSSINKKSINEQ